MSGRGQGRIRSGLQSGWRAARAAAGRAGNGAFRAGLPCAAMLAPAGVARAQETEAAAGLFGIAPSYEMVSSAILIGVVAVAFTTAFALMRQRRQAEELSRRLMLETTSLRADLDRIEMLIEADDQRVVAWSKAGDAPIVAGSLAEATGAPRAKTTFLSFGTWLAPEAASGLDRAIERLRAEGETFQLPLATKVGHFIEASGRVAGGQAIVRFRDLSAERREHAALVDTHARLKREADSLAAVLEASSFPAWMRDGSGRLAWANSAYARAVEVADGATAVERNLELLDGAGRQAAVKARAANTALKARLPVVVAGSRRIFDVIDMPRREGSVGIAVDVTDEEQMRADLARAIDFHARTVDQLGTAVAIFGADKRLSFYNAAYRELWALETTFLDGRPDDGQILDQLRSQRKLPEQADWRSWKRDLLACYTALETRQHWWYLPDGKTLRVLVNPHPQGGVTYIYENVTERLELEKNYNALIRVQGETLDHLSEGVAVFGSDGRLRLSNPALVEMWQLDPAMVAGNPHIGDVIGLCQRLHQDPDAWARLKGAVTGLAENRARTEGRMIRRNGSILDYATVPLPDGATMATFLDVTDSVNVEQALREKNEALVEADKVKTDFVGSVSYEMRSPLNTIIGFTHLLTDPKMGELTPKQREYAGYIASSSEQLASLVDGILDLATIDAGMMKLEIAPVDLGKAANAVAGALDKRLKEADARLDIDIAADAAVLPADAARLEQVLYNLTSNAIRYSKPGGAITLSARRDGGDVLVTVEDQGAGIPADQLTQVFDRFFARRQGARRGGAGLGLALVKSFVELHGGRVQIDSEEGRGTAVTCRFPGTAPAGKTAHG